MRSIALACFVATALLLAGCAGDGGLSGNTLAPTSGTIASSTVSATTSVADPDAEVGSILVVVTDPELIALSDVQVEISGADLTAFTDASGTATFNGLAPGSYTILIAKPGYTAQQSKGKVVDVVADETTEAKMVMDPVEIVDETNSYHTTLPFRAFISCAVEGQPGFVLNRNTPCGQWLNPGGVQLGDPNHKSRFTWNVDSPQISGIVANAKWQPATGVTGQQLRLVVTHKIECAQTCLWQDALLTFGGPSPLTGRVVQAPDNKITKKWGQDPATYPKPVFYEVGAYCTTNCQGAQVVWQQNVDLYLTAFYGAEPAQDFSALPP